MTVYRLDFTDSPGRYRIVNADLDYEPAVPTAVDPSVSTSLHPHQLPRWQDRYQAAIARASNTWDLLYRAAGVLG